MIKGDATCPGCGAGFRRIELSSERGGKGEYRCPACDEVLEVLPGESPRRLPHDRSAIRERATIGLIRLTHRSLPAVVRPVCRLFLNYMVDVALQALHSKRTAPRAP